MRRPRAVISVVLALVALALVLAACGGGADEGSDANATPPASGAPNPRTPDQGAPPDAPAALPPEFLDCVAAEGFEVDASGANLHSLPPQVLQTCFGSLHGGGAP